VRFSSVGLIALLLLFACSSKQNTETPLPSTGISTPKIDIRPLEATKETTFYIHSKDIDFSKAKIQWLVNGKPFSGATSSQFRSSWIKKGDIVQAKVLIDNREMVSNQITIKNIRPAIVRSKIVPSVPKAVDTLKAEVTASDRDGDNVTLSYEWSTNGVPSGKSNTLEGPFLRGDKISLKVTPFDGSEFGRSVILSAMIHNAPPRPEIGSEGRIEKRMYMYQIKATDPDGDPLTYELKEAPEGMVIDRSTGLISWKIAEEDTSRHPVSVRITDDHGGEVLYNFDITLSFERSP
jgi:hypothetical protein